MGKLAQQQEPATLRKDVSISEAGNGESLSVWSADVQAPFKSQRALMTLVRTSWFGSSARSKWTKDTLHRPSFCWLLHPCDRGLTRNFSRYQTYQQYITPQRRSFKSWSFTGNPNMTVSKNLRVDRFLRAEMAIKTLCTYMNPITMV